MRVDKIIKKMTGAGSILMLSLSLASCGSNTENLMVGITAQAGGTQTASGQSYIESAADFSVRMFQQTARADQNTMVSPVSILAAMSMAGSGAKNDTLKQINQVLYRSQDTDSKVKELSGWLKKMEEHSENTFSSANSMWIKDDKEQFIPNEEFLQKNANTFASEVYRCDFEEDTLTDINRWVKKNTNGMIPKLMDRIEPDTVVQLINAVTFDDKWEEPYTSGDVMEDLFTEADGSREKVEYLCSTEGRYIETENAVGVVKPYQHGCSFVAVLPNEGESLKTYIKDMSGAEWLTLMNSTSNVEVKAMLPKFKSESTMILNDALYNMGIKDAFDVEKADFSGMGETNGSNLVISKVLHKTFIEVNEEGTRASAVTGVMLDTASEVAEVTKRVEFTRPFLYAIIDNETNLPIFMGTVTNV